MLGKSNNFEMMNKKNAFPELSNSLEDYIEAVRNIELEKGCATVGEIAEALNVKKPSVSLAMKQLKERGLVEYAGSRLAAGDVLMPAENK